MAKTVINANEGSGNSNSIYNQIGKNIAENKAAKDAARAKSYAAASNAAKTVANNTSSQEAINKALTYAGNKIQNASDYDTYYKNLNNTDVSWAKDSKNALAQQIYANANKTYKGADPNYSNYDQYRTSTDVSWAKDSKNALAQKMYQNVYGTNTGYTGGSTGSTGYNDYYAQLLDLFTNTNEQARQNQINAILSNLSATKSAYKNRIQQVMDEYDSLINQNEVNKYRARKSIRENQANRGQLNSGLGRQEQLQMNMNYDNNANELNTARQNAINEIYNLITQAEAEAEQNKATVNNTYANALLQYQLANQ